MQMLIESKLLFFVIDIVESRQSITSLNAGNDISQTSKWNINSYNRYPHIPQTVDVHVQVKMQSRKMCNDTKILDDNIIHWKRYYTSFTTSKARFENHTQ
jgi:hypothetical protein